MFKIIIAVLFCCCECMASYGDDSFSEFCKPYKSLNDLKELNNNDDYNDLWIKGSPHSSGNLEGFDNKFGIEKFPQVPTVVKGFFIVPLPSIKESSDDCEPEPKKSNKKKPVQPSNKKKPKKPEEDEEDTGFLCCKFRCNLI